MDTKRSLHPPETAVLPPLAWGSLAFHHLWRERDSISHELIKSSSLDAKEKKGCGERGKTPPETMLM